MNARIYTRDKGAKRRVEPENQTKNRSHAGKLKNETSRAAAMRKKLRTGKADTAESKLEIKKTASNTIIATSFTAQDADIIAVEADYQSLETDLQRKIDNIETDYPGYDEYNYSLSEISHNPFELAALLTVLYEDYTESEVQTMLQTIFDYEYTLSIQRVVETRTRTETRWHWVTYYRDEERTGYRMVNGHLEEYSYTVSVPYL